MRTVLIIDDDQDDIELTERALLRKGRGITSATASRGEEALALLRSGVVLPSLILLDLKMPGMSGIDTLRQIRADERLKRIPVVIITNSTLESDRNEALAAGADGFLHKAFNMEEYGRDIQAQLDRCLKD